MKEPNTRDQLDLLLHLEKLTEELNRRMNSRSQAVLRRYPLTFTLVALFGIVAVSEGVKGILEKINFFQNNPSYLFIAGLLTLIILGSVYKKLDK